ncbi:MAG: hypothetical protein ACK41C_16790 [Phenylobacterium sp.]|jgi:hypothetical protein|uniref:hypothetical protein n=1 Tax=Phenylobacterium sp. TaxID=1871053 RepID=UPI003918F3AE
MKITLAATLAGAALAFAAAPALAENAHAGHEGHAEAPAKLSAENSPIADIAANEAGKAALEKNLPGITSHEAYDQFKGMTLKQLQPLSQGMITDDSIAAVQAELDKI